GSCPELHCLGLRGCLGLTDHHLNDFFHTAQCIKNGSLVSMNLSQTCIGTLAVQALGLKGSHLQSLDVSDCSAISGASLRMIAKGCKSLQSLRFLGCRKISALEAWNVIFSLPLLEEAAIPFLVTGGHEPIEGAAASEVVNCLSCLVSSQGIQGQGGATLCGICGADASKDSSDGSDSETDTAQAALGALSLRTPSARAAAGGSCTSTYPLPPQPGKGLKSLELALTYRADHAGDNSESCDTSDGQAVLAMAALCPLLPRGIETLKISSASSSHGSCAVRCEAVDLSSLDKFCPSLTSLDISVLAMATSGLDSTESALATGLASLSQLTFTNHSDVAGVLEALALRDGNHVTGLKVVKLEQHPPSVTTCDEPSRIQSETITSLSL
ncbi:unnamed protein product, partial [Chrysoparadoxa australica]